MTHDDLRQVQRTVLLDGHRTTMRLEQVWWDTLDDICRRYGMTRDALLSELARRARRLHGEKAGITAAVRVACVCWARNAATEYGHTVAGHGQGDPLAGTPFDLPEEAPSACSAAVPAPPPDRPDTPAPARRASRSG